MHLTSQQTLFFRHNGYLKLPEALPKDLVDRLKAAIAADIEAETDPVQRDGDGRVVRISDVLGRGDVFRETVAHPLVLEPLESLLGPNIEMLTNRHNHATLRTASAYGGKGDLHRDVRQWSRTIVTVITYLEQTTVENGCTLIVPGSHLLPWQGSQIYDVSDFDDVVGQAVPVPMPAGGMLAIDGTVVHGVGQNTTDGTRTSMTIGYHSVDELMDVDNPKRILVRGERIYNGNDIRS